MNKYIKTLILVFIMFTSIHVVEANPGVSISAPSSAKVGDTVNITVNNTNGDYLVEGTLSVSGGASGSLAVFMQTKDSQTLSVKITKDATVNISFNGRTVNVNDPEKASGIQRSASVSIAKPAPAPKPGSSGNSSSGGGSQSSQDAGNASTSTGTYNSSLPKGETEAEKNARLEKEAAEKLAELTRQPVFTEISLISQDTRLNGENVGKVKTEVDTFKYTYKLPRSIRKFSLDIKTDKDVKLTYDKLYQLDENHDKVVVIIDAEKGEVKQKYELTIELHKESEVTLADNYALVSDSIIDAELKKLGVEVVKGEKFSYYRYNNQDFVLTIDAYNVAQWVLLKDEAFDKVVILTVDQNENLRFLVNIEDTELKDNLHNGKAYEVVDVEVSNLITLLDESLAFNNQLYGWNTDKGVITHELVNGNPELAFVGKDTVHTAYISWDVVDKRLEYYAYAMTALFALTAAASIVALRKKSEE